jgi:Tol biopolymer transport system component
MTDHELERRLRTWYQAEIPDDEAAPAALRSRLATIPQASPAPSRQLTSRRGFTLLAAAVLLATALLGGALLVGSGTLQLPSVLPPVLQPSQTPSLEPSTAEPTIAAVPGRIVYTRRERLANGEADCITRVGFCDRASIFVSNQDGSDERELIPGPRSEVVTISPDGSRLVIRQRKFDGDHTYLTDINGSEPRMLEEDWAFRTSYGAFSPDGSRLAFARCLGPDESAGSVVVIMDLATGEIVQLDSTKGVAGFPNWSPDGGHLLFGPFVVDADGSNLHQLIATDLNARDARWSPDGSLIVFTSSIETLTTNPPDSLQRLSDIYVVRPDGTGLQRLTTDTVGPLGTTEPGDFGAMFPTWTRDGRIVFTRMPGPGETDWQLWVMDRDGSNATRLDQDAATLTAIGCVSCPYPAVNMGWIPYPSMAFWTSTP